MCVCVLPYCTINVESTVFLRIHLLIVVENVFISSFFAVLKRFVVCMCVLNVIDFVGFGYGIFFDFWIKFREYAPFTTTQYVWVFFSFFFFFIKYCFEENSATTSLLAIVCLFFFCILELFCLQAGLTFQLVDNLITWFVFQHRKDANISFKTVKLAHQSTAAQLHL